jgi:EPS-associated MarR family transcriptional regulator
MAVACPYNLLTQTTETHLKVLRHLEQTPEITQRELAKELGISLGKVNYCLQALIGKGLVKAKNFKNSDKKRAYLYILTPKGIDAKARISLIFLKRKKREYENLSQEIEQLKAELDAQGARKRT